MSDFVDLRLGDIAPNFEADTTQGRIRFHSWLGSSWCVLFSHPKDFTPVCTTEIGAVAKIQDEFDKRNVKLIGLSVDDLATHFKWLEDVRETQGVEVNFPLIADPSKEVARRYGMVHPKADTTYTVRSVFVIDPDAQVRLIMTYPASTGRSIPEILRVVDALQLTDREDLVTPANWESGKPCIISPCVTDQEELTKRFPQGWKEIKPYLRMVEYQGVNKDKH